MSKSSKCRALIGFLVLIAPFAFSDSVNKLDTKTTITLESVHQAVKEIKKQTEQLSGELTESRAENRNTQNALAQLLNESQSLRAKNDVLQSEQLHEKRLSKKEALFLLFGLLMEVLGGTLLAAAHLSAKQFDVISLKTTHASLNFALHDSEHEKTMNFLGALGALLLLSGFAFEFSGTAMVLNLRPILNILAILIATLMATFVLIFLAGQTPGQNRREKIRIFFRNIQKVFLYPLIDLLSLRIRCDYCLEKMNVGQSLTVWWLEEPNTPTYPYLYAPHGFRLVHTPCYSKDRSCILEDLPSKFMAEKVSSNIRESEFNSFLQTEVPRMQQWFIGHLAKTNLNSIKTLPVTGPQAKFNALVEKLNALKNK